ncbi:MAG TPA: hypothetical protein VFA10_04485 [Ktedonobacteraceae bacterium]|nr:hypothetical protein [Ktedonobacteraceae bacterium]
MSMSEFERELNRWEDDSPGLSMQERVLPSDFSMEDVAFAQELEALFSISEEETPPYFVQTLLEPEDPRFQVVEHGFEHKTSARVFRRLNLKRRLFHSRHPAQRKKVTGLPLQRPFIAVIAACLLFMFITMAATATSFASGIEVLFAGPHSGVSLWSHYPGEQASHLHTKAQKVQARQTDTTPQARRINLLEAQEQLHFSMYWPQAMPDNYALTTISLYDGPDHPWADGPVLELDYSYTAHGVSPHGTGQIAICEFKPTGEVLQAVQTGSAHTILIDSKTHTAAIYVDGQWVRINKYSHDWLYGVRSELIYERDGIVFWIVGDQRDGIDDDVLGQIASSLRVFNVHLSTHVASVSEPLDDSTWLFAEDVIYLDDATSSSAGTSSVESSPVSQNKLHSK